MIPSALRHNRVFVILSILFIIALAIACALVDKGDLHLWLNSCHGHGMDIFCRYYTYGGDWVPYVVLTGLLFYRVGWALFMAADIAITTLLVQGIKHLVNAPRPILWFGEHMPDVQLPLVEGVHMHSYLSFPSGHTVSFFILFFVLSAILCEALYAKPYRHARCACALTGVCLFIMAVLGAYTRVYLSQHFAQDVLGGVVIAMVVSIALCWWLPSFLSITRPRLK